MGRRLSPETRALRDQGAPIVGAVIAYGSHDDGFRIGEVIEVDVEIDDEGQAEITLTLANALIGHTWLVVWDRWQADYVIGLSLSNVERLKKEATQ